MFHPLFLHYLLELGQPHVALFGLELRKPLLLKGFVGSLHPLLRVFVHGNLVLDTEKKQSTSHFHCTDNHAAKAKEITTEL